MRLIGLQTLREVCRVDCSTSCTGAEDLTGNEVTDQDVLLIQCVTGSKATDDTADLTVTGNVTGVDTVVEVAVLNSSCDTTCHYPVIRVACGVVESVDNSGNSTCVEAANEEVFVRAVAENTACVLTGAGNVTVVGAIREGCEAIDTGNDTACVVAGGENITEVRAVFCNDASVEPADETADLVTAKNVCVVHTIDHGELSFLRVDEAHETACSGSKAGRGVECNCAEVDTAVQYVSTGAYAVADETAACSSANVTGNNAEVSGIGYSQLNVDRVTDEAADRGALDGAVVLTVGDVDHAGCFTDEAADECARRILREVKHRVGDVCLVDNVHEREAVCSVCECADSSAVCEDLACDLQVRNNSVVQSREDRSGGGDGVSCTVEDTVECMCIGFGQNDICCQIVVSEGIHCEEFFSILDRLRNERNCELFFLKNRDDNAFCNFFHFVDFSAVESVHLYENVIESGNTLYGSEINVTGRVDDGEHVLVAVCSGEVVFNIACKGSSIGCVGRECYEECIGCGNFSNNIVVLHYVGECICVACETADCNVLRVGGVFSSDGACNNTVTHIHSLTLGVVTSVADDTADGVGCAVGVSTGEVQITGGDTVYECVVANRAEGVLILNGAADVTCDTANEVVGGDVTGVDTVVEDAFVVDGACDTCSSYPVLVAVIMAAHGGAGVARSVVDVVSVDVALVAAVFEQRAFEGNSQNACYVLTVRNNFTVVGAVDELRLLVDVTEYLASFSSRIDISVVRGTSRNDTACIVTLGLNLTVVFTALNGGVAADRTTDTACLVAAGDVTFVDTVCDVVNSSVVIGGTDDTAGSGAISIDVCSVGAACYKDVETSCNVCDHTACMRVSIDHAVVLAVNDGNCVDTVFNVTDHTAEGVAFGDETVVNTADDFDVCIEDLSEETCAFPLGSPNGTVVDTARCLDIAVGVACEACCIGETVNVSVVRYVYEFGEGSGVSKCCCAFGFLHIDFAFNDEVCDDRVVGHSEDGSGNRDGVSVTVEGTHEHIRVGCVEGDVSHQDVVAAHIHCEEFLGSGNGSCIGDDFFFLFLFLFVFLGSLFRSFGSFGKNNFFVNDFCICCNECESIFQYSDCCLGKRTANSGVAYHDRICFCNIGECIHAGSSGQILQSRGHFGFVCGVKRTRIDLVTALSVVDLAEVEVVDDVGTRIVNIAGVD